MPAPRRHLHPRRQTHLGHRGARRHSDAHRRSPNLVTKRIRLARTDKPVGLVLSPDETRLYAATGRGNGVAVIDTKTHKVLKTIPTGTRVRGIALPPHGRKVYAANSLGNTISVIDTASLRVVKTIATGDGPWGLAIK